MKKQRKHYTPEEKLAILRRHLVEGVPVSDLCDDRGPQPTVFYRWEKEFFENGATAFPICAEGLWHLTERVCTVLTGMRGQAMCFQ